MASFLDVKNYICRILRQTSRNREQITVDESSDIVFDFDENTFTLVNSELKEVFDRVCQSEQHDMDLLSNRTLEVALSFKNNTVPLTFRDFPFLNLTADETGMSFTVSEPSLEYCVFLITLLCDKQTEGANYRRPFFSYHPHHSHDNDEDEQDSLEDVQFNWREALIGIFRRYRTLKMRSTKEQDYHSFVDLRNDYLFTCMYNLEPRLCPVECHHLEELFPRRELYRSRSTAFSAPLRHYHNELVEFYKTAISASDPFIQYISFYHVLEFYFDETFKKHLVNVIRSKITLPDFSYRNDDKLLDLAKAIRKEVKENADETQGSERDTLKYLLQQYVTDIEKVKTRISTLSKSNVDAAFYQHVKVAFVNTAKAKTISWNDANQVHLNLADRIYQTRNALVHSKKENDGGVYNPAGNEGDLIKEIPLIRAIAEEIIINSSTIID